MPRKQFPNVTQAGNLKLLRLSLYHLPTTKSKTYIPSCFSNQLWRLLKIQKIFCIIYWYICKDESKNEEYFIGFYILKDHGILMRFVSRIFITDQCKFAAFHNITKCLHFTNSLSFSSKLWPTKVSIAQYIYASKAKKKLLKILPDASIGY